MYSYKRDDVLAFYEKLQFNETSTPAVQAEMIREENAVKAIYPDEDDLYYAERVIEYGCGAGWLSNSLAYYYGCVVEAVDFNPKAIEAAKRTSEILGVSDRVRFAVGDLFTYKTEPADLVISNGVLHHTSDCMQGIIKLSRDVKKGGVLFIGLYHKFARKPFIDHFTWLKEKGLSEDELFAEYKRLDGRSTDEKHAMSWFMDQVMHPHETQHTLKEVVDTFSKCDVKLEKTSINGYIEINDYDSTNGLKELHRIFKYEKELYQVGEMYMDEGKYYPGFFYCKGRKA